MLVGIWEVWCFTREDYKLHFDTNIYMLQVVVLVLQYLIPGTGKMLCKSGSFSRPLFFSVTALAANPHWCWMLPIRFTDLSCFSFGHVYLQIYSIWVCTYIFDAHTRVLQSEFGYFLVMH